MPQTKTCRVSGKNFTIRDDDLAFYNKIGVPPPTLSPKERARRRFCFRNERVLYRRNCEMCKQDKISIYSPDKDLTTYCQKCWWEDSWDAKSFGRDFDFNRPFFEQFHELIKTVPRYMLYNVASTNCDYCHQMYGNKDSYLCFVFKDCEDCMYLSHATGDRDCLDSRYLHNSELCYECIDCEKLYDCSFCENCKSSSNLKFCYDCIGCQDCFGSAGLRNKQYYIFNKPYSREEYFETIKSLKSRKKIEEQFKQIKNSVPRREVWGLNMENSTGDYLNHAKNCHECYDSFDIEDCAYCVWIFRAKDSYDCYGMGDSELNYEGIGIEEVNRCFFNMFTTSSSDVHYSDGCFSSKNLFGCVGMKKAEYCILNKQYSREEYESLRLRIIEHMKSTGEYGEFFPKELSPFCYNETIAQENMPLSREEALRRGFKWKD